MNGTGSTPPPGPGAVAPGQTAFYDSAMPPLPAGDYQLIIQQTVQVTPNAPEPPYSFKQRLQVAGPHLQLSPADVVAKRPFPGASGDFQSWLPHVVLAERTLPWQIPIADPAPGGGGSSPAPGTPWLALFLLTQRRDRRQRIPAQPDQHRCPDRPARRLPAASRRNPGPNLTTGLSDLQQEQPPPTCTVVDVHFDAFRAIAPLTTELPWLASVRQVDTTDQEDLDVPSPGWYSVIVGNRLPVGAADNLYIAHLVSLEGFAGYLPDQPPPGTVPSLMRLVSLASWSFTSGPDPGNFAQLMENLNDDAQFVLPVTVPATDPAGQLVARAVQLGYVPLRYATRLGEETTGWYRGPLQPIELADNPQPPYPAASSALIFDPSSGMFDASYAAAWELGRLLTLANGPVTASLTQWAARRREHPAAAPGTHPRRRHGTAGDPRPRGGRGLPSRPPAHRRTGPANPARSRRGSAGARNAGRPDRTEGIRLPRAARRGDPRGDFPRGRRRVPATDRPGAQPSPPAQHHPRRHQRRNFCAARISPRGRWALMPGRPPRHEALPALAQDPGAQAAVKAQAGPVPADVSSWLSDLGLLIGLPFVYLVPDGRMLPTRVGALLRHRPELDRRPG